MILFYAYCLCLALAMALSFAVAGAKHDWALGRCSVALLLNWVATMVAGTSGLTDAWYLNIPVDAITAYVILMKPAGKWQAALGITYCIQIIAHVAYGTRMTLDMGADAMEYYNQLTWVAFLQLVLLGSWTLGLWRRGNSDSWGDRRATTLDAGPSSLGRTG